ncbi:sialate O-acetylesterase [Arcticibacter sp.]|uniref:sialate O-acetylesterase n=1 Tax=Arcticibacter sp. TaxID=1872630 RepID=UPI00388E46B4
MMKRLLVLAICLTAFSHLRAEVVLPRILGHNMVLQRDQPVSIWGKASVGEQVQVSFAGQRRSAQTDANGNWMVVLEPLKASGTGRDLSVTGTNTIILKNILVGEVWLSSGQSNMEYTMRKNSKVARPFNGRNPVDELQYADNDSIRIFLVNRKELIKPDPTHRGWSVARDSALRSFSAAAYFFAKELGQKLGVPVGMISSAVPGSRIEPWIPAVLMPDGDGEPGKFYQPMIEPLQPFAIKGFLWYQGESNCFLNERAQYTDKMKMLINSWRTAWGRTDLPFYYAQLAPFYYSKSDGKIKLEVQSLPEFREAQEQALQVSNTGMIITTDLASDINDIHPPMKWEIGRRLALMALTDTYGVDVVGNGPVFIGMDIRDGKAELHFNYTGSGIYSKDGQPLRCFSIAGKDGKFVPAAAVIRNNKVVVSSPAVKVPANVRFAWNEADQPNLYNREGLPAAPFRTDRPAGLINNELLYTNN